MRVEELDKKIIELTKKNEDKENELRKVKRFNPVTSMIMPLDGRVININTLDNNSLEVLMIDIHMRLESSKKLKINPFFGEYQLKDWFSDIKGRRNKLSILAQKKELANNREKLEQLLSNQARNIIAFEEIEKNLSKG